MNSCQIRKAKTLLLLIAIISIALSACQSKPPLLTPISPEETKAKADATQIATLLADHATPTPIPSATPWPVATNTPQPEPRENLLGITNPLTGLKIKDPDLLRQRPLLVKIVNWPQSFRPAEGLNKADMVFEYYHGAQVNNLIALYYGNDHPHVGPLGDGSVVDARLTEHQQGVLVVGTVYELVESVLDNYLVDRFARRGFIPCPGICTDTVAQGGKTWVDTAAVRTALSSSDEANKTPELFGLKFAEIPPDSNQTAQRFSYLYADFSVMDWRFNTESGKYELWQDELVTEGRYKLSKAEDRATGEPIAFENIVFLFTNYVNYRNLFYDINFDDGNTQQRGILLRDGKLYHINWSTSAYDQPFLFFNLNGEAFKLKPGRTWITLSTNDSKIEQVDEDEWDMHFIIK
ncbi:MAG TPA: DUF3048 C-terminal domain-containing protein [Anaerolineaceae bacterium]|nr:DUF3048 C-terminal domain-containing protein [Anaerolineaceae bacterium]